MSHPILTLRSCAVIAGFTGFFWYLSQSFRGPWQSKYQLPERERQKYLDIPEFAANFHPDSHPALRKHTKVANERNMANADNSSASHQALEAVKIAKLKDDNERLRYRVKILERALQEETSRRGANNS